MGGGSPKPARLGEISADACRVLTTRESAVGDTVQIVLGEAELSVVAQEYRGRILGHGKWIGGSDGSLQSPASRAG